MTPNRDFKHPEQGDLMTPNRDFKHPEQGDLMTCPGVIR
jgi:hypothetical protein